MSVEIYCDKGTGPAQGDCACADWVGRPARPAAFCGEPNTALKSTISSLREKATWEKRATRTSREKMMEGTLPDSSVWGSEQASRGAETRDKIYP